jgi:two-component system, OmpR family, phosphate regulon sensor histidine kinase PhoR
MKNRLFWKLGLLYLSMLLLVLIALDLYVVRAIRREYLEAAYTQLESLSRLASAKPPQPLEESALKGWAGQFASSGIRMTLVAEDGKVMADSDEDPARMESHRMRQEIQDAFLKGSGRAVRHSTTLGHDLVYFATRHDPPNAKPLVIRLSLPLHRLDEALFAFRGRLWSISLLILAMAGGISLLFFRIISGRIGRLKEFSRRVAEGDFRPLAIDLSRDELSELADTLNQTASKLDNTIRTLTDERNQSAAILASMEEGVAVIGCDQRAIYCNRAFCRAVGVPNISWAGRPVMELIRHSDLFSYVQKALTGAETIHGEIVIGSIRTRSFDVTAAPVRSEGSITGAVIVLHDISEIRRLERARRDFIANISHEFKTPLTAIQGFAETLLGGALEDIENRRRFLGIIREHALRLGRLTEDLLKLAQIEAGQMQREARPVAVSEIIETCMETVRVKAEQKKLLLEAEYADDLPLLHGDLQAFQEILNNLLDNALRYTAAGGRVKVKAALEASEMVISVSDTGIGIPKADQDRIFERFYRTDAARSRESGGTGLGLSIVKHLAEVYGGWIKVESEVGIGSVFYVFLPVSRQ